MWIFLRNETISNRTVVNKTVSALCQNIKLIFKENVCIKLLHKVVGDVIVFFFYVGLLYNFNGNKILLFLEPVCGYNQEMKAERNIRKQFYTPPYPTYYYSSWLSCWYTVTAPTDSRIKFSFKTNYYYYYSHNFRLRVNFIFINFCL